MGRAIGLRRNILAFESAKISPIESEALSQFYWLGYAPLTGQAEIPKRRIY